MAKESAARGLGCKYGPGGCPRHKKPHLGTWGRRHKGQLLRRVGKTARDKAPRVYV